MAAARQPACPGVEHEIARAFEDSVLRLPPRSHLDDRQPVVPRRQRVKRDIRDPDPPVGSYDTADEFAPRARADFLQLLDGSRSVLGVEQLGPRDSQDRVVGHPECRGE